MNIQHLPSFDQQYARIMREILDYGKLRPNRTGVGTLAIPSSSICVDLALGFPLLTLKKTAFKVIAVELDGFLRGITQKAWYQERGCSIWNEWCNPEQLPDGLTSVQKTDWQMSNPDLGPIGYAQWGGFGRVHKPAPFIYTGFDLSLRTVSSSEPLVGRDFNGRSGPYRVVQFDGLDRHSNKRFTVKFNKTGFVKAGLNSLQITSCSVRDPYAPSVFGVAALGEPKNGRLSTKHVTLLKGQWRAMIRRCYDESDAAYPAYGGRKVWVCNRWLLFANFLQDVQELKGWANKLADWKSYQLDKDTSGGAHYSADTCQWISASDNANYTSASYWFDATGPNGDLYENNVGLARFCKRHHLKTRVVEASLKAGGTTHGGWKFKRLNKLKPVVRVDGVDQLDALFKSLASSPDSRRMLVSAWNPVDLPRMALPPCHAIWQVLVIDGALHLNWFQRSCDFFLGIPFNVASYSLLTHILAAAFGYVPGRVTGFFGDSHIYENAVEATKNLLRREPYLSPRVEVILNQSLGADAVRMWTHNDVDLIDYKSHPALKVDVVT